MRRWRVALMGYYGFGNLGDELLLRASLEGLERCGVGWDSVIVLSNAPEKNRRDFPGPGVASVSRWSFRDVRWALSSSDSLLLGGGGLFQDSTSLGSCLWYWGLVRLARLCGARVWAIGQSIGPLKTRWGQWLTRSALGSCDALHLRDAPSMEWAGRLGLRGAVRGDDLALTLDAPQVPSGEKNLFLLNLRHGHPAALHHLEAFRGAFPGGEAVGVALSPEDKVPLERLMKEGQLARVVLLERLEDAAPLWSRAVWAAGMRLHFAVLSVLFRTPLAVFPYDPKVSAFAERVGVPADGDAHAPVLPRLPVSQEELRDKLDTFCRGFLDNLK